MRSVTTLATLVVVALAVAACGGNRQYQHSQPAAVAHHSASTSGQCVQKWRNVVDSHGNLVKRFPVGPKRCSASSGYSGPPHVRIVRPSGPPRFAPPQYRRHGPPPRYHGPPQRHHGGGNQWFLKGGLRGDW